MWVACTGSDGSTASTDPPPVTVECPTWAEAIQTGQVAESALNELSGLAMTQAQGPLWAHNDSGSGAELHALDLTGAFLGTVSLTGIDARDWEDLAATPQGGLWIADIGDNNAERSSVSLHHLTTAPAIDAGDVQPTSYNLIYQGGPRDAEAVMVDIDGEVYVVDKQEDGQSGLFRADLDAGTFRREADLAIEGPGALARTITAGDISPDGSYIVLRTYFSAFVWRRQPGTSLASAFDEAPCALDIPVQRQGETIAFDATGTALYTVSEGNDQPVWRIDAR